MMTALLLLSTFIVGFVTGIGLMLLWLLGYFE